MVRAGPEYELLATNRMGEVCLAMPAISDGQILIRTTGHLIAAAAGIAPAVAATTGAETTPFPAQLATDATLPFDDFEDGDAFANTGVRWQTFTNGVSTADLRLVEAGAAATARAARLDGELLLGAARGPLAQMYLPFDRGAMPVDLSQLGGVVLYARGSGSFELSLRCADGEFGAELAASEEWRRIEIGVDELRALGEPETPAAWNGTGCRGLYLSRRGQAALGEFWFEVDEVSLHGAGSWQARSGDPAQQQPR